MSAAYKLLIEAIRSLVVRAAEKRDPSDKDKPYMVRRVLTDAFPAIMAEPRLDDAILREFLMCMVIYTDSMSVAGWNMFLRKLEFVDVEELSDSVQYMAGLPRDWHIDGYRLEWSKLVMAEAKDALDKEDAE